MSSINRREFGAAALVFVPSLRAAARVSPAKNKSIDEVLRSGIEKRSIPCVTAVVANRNDVTYQGAFGKRDGASGMPVKMDSIFSIASMTKAITAAAAMQLVERGKMDLNAPAAKYMPAIGNLQVLDGYDAAGKPMLRAPKTPVTLKHLLTHTSGLCYDMWSDEMKRWEKATGQNGIPLGVVAPAVPLMFDPGARWQYGYSMDYAGKLVEAVSGLTLEQYFQKNILQPLGMNDTSFILAAETFDRLVSAYGRHDGGPLMERPRAMPAPPKDFNGGGGLYSTAGDYLKFTQMILRRGRGAHGERILHPKTVAMMSANQTGMLPAGRLTTQNADTTSDVDLHPGSDDRYTFGFLMNPVGYAGGRSARSLAWAGIYNTFYWIDPKRDLSAVIMMQFLPFVDKEAVGMLSDFEHAVYAA